MKNIVLLSDGTGNGAAKKNKTNVWRLYAALNLHDDKQIAMHDDGVGSKDSLWSRVLGGAFGFGLKRNVIELYKYLCRNYEVSEDDKEKEVPENSDKIYLFGFSRGAFTVRVLAGFIAKMGLCTEYKTEKELHEYALQKYRAYWKAYSHGYLSRLVNVILSIFRKESGLHSNVKPNIEFIGVWDTVDAYGFPIDELAILWDFFIYPIRFPDHKLTGKVNCACHAIAVDDERHSFHPIIWDESEEKSNRIQQVWFPGMHADVGGGYTRKSLALVSLDWMLTRVEADNTKDGLLFIDNIRQQYHSQSDWNGPLHDSRAGLGMYYRYKPRNIAHICSDKCAGVSITKPKIHQSVLERIKGHSVPYAPTGIPVEYEVVSTDLKKRSYETSEQGSKRATALNQALDIVYWRRGLYFLILFATILLLASGFFLDWEENGICKGSACFIDPVIQVMMNSLPDFTATWFEALRQNPKWLWGFTGLFFLLLFVRNRAWLWTRQAATCAWAVLKGRGEELVPKWKPGITAMLRKVTQASLIAWLLRWFPATGLFIVILYLIGSAINGVLFHYRYTTGAFCNYSNSTIKLISTETKSFDISNACYASGIKLIKGTSYTFKVSDAVLRDGDSYQTDADGFSADSLIPLVPLRRHMTQPWLKLFGKIGNRRYETFELGVGETVYTPRADGELFLYVNDAVFGLLPEWDRAYHWERGKNSGQVTVTIAPH